MLVLIPVVCERAKLQWCGNYAGKVENINQIASRIIISPFSLRSYLAGGSELCQGGKGITTSSCPEIINLNIKLTAGESLAVSLP